MYVQVSVSANPEGIPNGTVAVRVRSGTYKGQIAVVHPKNVKRVGRGFGVIESDFLSIFPGK